MNFDVARSSTERRVDGSSRTSRSSGRTLVVNDFVGIDLGFGATVDAVERRATTDVIAQLLVQAWNAELIALDPGEGVQETRVDPQVAVELGPQRTRSDATFFPLRWESDGGTWLAPLDADLEIVRFGRVRTHLHLLGISRCPPECETVAPVVDRCDRLTVAFVRRFLTMLADQLRTTDPGTQRS